MPKPFWMRAHCSCPDCGMILDADNWSQAFDKASNFDCPRCKAHYSAQDFEAESAFKHSREHQPITD